MKTISPPRPEWAGLLAVTALFLLSRPYHGIEHDARLYLGAAFARLHPNGAGRDLVFVDDGQFGLSLYPFLLTGLVAALGLAKASLVATLVGLAAWLFALLALSRRLADGASPRLKWLVRVLVICAPAFYGGLQVFSFGEPFAAPRALAEAAGMAGMAQLLSGRRWSALALAASGALFHPIMALGGLGVVFVALCLENWRWAGFAVGGLALLVVATVLKLPLASRLAMVMDPQWLSLVKVRDSNIFLSNWHGDAWGHMAVQAASLIVAAVLSAGAKRRLFWAALATGLAGVSASILLGDGLSLTLVLQAQLWRMLQPMALLAAAALAVCMHEAPRRGPGARLAVVALAIGWLLIDTGWVAALATAFALLAFALERRLPSARSARLNVVAWAILGAVIALYAVQQGQFLRIELAALPVGLRLVWQSGLPGLVCVAAVSLWALRPDLRLTPPVAMAGAVGLAALAGALWDDRSRLQRHEDAGPDPGLTGLLASRPGEILWLGEDVTEVWFLADRSSWSSELQGAGMVFSRPLALATRSRADRVIAAGLAGGDLLAPLTMHRQPVPKLDATRIAAFCRAPDAPAWIIAPARDGDSSPAALKALIWRSPAPFRRAYLGPEGLYAVTTPAFAAIPCRRSEGGM